jgi:hypothetical protein
MTNNLGRCKFCGSENVRNPKTGKIFCADKCWLKNKPNELGAYPPKKPDWDKIRHEKSEGLAKGAAFNKACDIVIAMYQKGDVTREGIIQMIIQVFTELKEINQNGNEEAYENLE